MTGAGETWLIVGASSAVSRAFARLVAGRGCALILAGRDGEDLERSRGDLLARGAAEVAVAVLDLRDAAARRSLAEQAAAVAGTVNVFVAVGIMPPQTEIDTDPERIVSVIDTNLTATAVLLSHLAPALAARGRGRVIVLGSVAGDRGRLKNYVYGSAKAGLHAFLQGYRARLFRSGVHVMTVKPGFLDTAMTWGLGKLPLAMAPEAFAAAVLRAAAQGRDEVYVPGLWRWIMLVLRHVPERLFKRTDI